MGKKYTLTCHFDVTVHFLSLFLKFFFWGGEGSDEPWIDRSKNNILTTGFSWDLKLTAKFMNSVGSDFSVVTILHTCTL